MAEYIEREALKQSIRIMPRTTHPELVLYSSVQKVISDEPTADVVEVVRCKDCKWYQEGKLLAPNKFCFRLKHPKEDRRIGYNYSPDDFCNFGEKRSEDNGKR